MQFLGQCLDLDKYVRKSPKKNFFVHSAINKMREEHKVFSSRVNIPLVIQGFLPVFAAYDLGVSTAHVCLLLLQLHLQIDQKYGQSY